MATAEFQSTISEPWASVEPVTVGDPSARNQTPDRYVLVDAGQKLLRIDIYESPQAFEEVLIWHDVVVIGFGNHVFLVSIFEAAVIAIDVGGYFAHFYADKDLLLAASESRLFHISRIGELIWTTEALGLDGVIVERVEGGIVYGEGEWDPPGGWKPFAVSLDSGAIVA